MDKVKQLLEAIDSHGGVDSYSKNKNSRNAWNAAFVLYKRAKPQNKMRKGCESCRTIIYNWLRQNV